MVHIKFENMIFFSSLLDSHSDFRTNNKCGAKYSDIKLSDIHRSTLTQKLILLITPIMTAVFQANKPVFNVI